MELVMQIGWYIFGAYLLFRFATCWFYNYALNTESKEDDKLAKKLWNIASSGGKALADVVTFKRNIK